MDWVRVIKKCFDANTVLYTSHARREMKVEGFGEILEKEVYEVISVCEVIKEYPDDTPYPSALLFGMTQEGRPIHIVCAYNSDDDEIIIITVYHPDPALWDNYRRRKK